MNFLIEYIGYFAGVCTTIAFIPQVTKVWLSKNVEGLSTSMFIIFSIGVCCWLIYGIIQNNAYSEFKYDGDYSEFRLELNGLIKIKGFQNKIFKSDISAQGFGRKEVLIDCNPKQVSMIAVGNSISQYLKVISENIYAGISRIK